MGISNNYGPKASDIVFFGGSFVRYVVTSVNDTRKTVDLRTPGAADVAVLHRDVPWGKIRHLDESENALRVRARSY